jgi:hypothetical protein
MQYMLIIAQDENAPGPAEGTAEYDAGRQSWIDYTRDLLQSGALVSGASLQPTTTATTVRQAGGASSVTDGPFMESKEQLVGYYVIEVADLDAALEWAKKMPVGDGSVEIRPVSIMPDIQGMPQVAGTGMQAGV